VPQEIDGEWRDRWHKESERYDQSPPPGRFLDPVDLLSHESADIAATNAKTAERALSGSLELLRRTS
jgi:hypothetical protein